MIEAFFFGEDGNEIFGTYHAPGGMGTGALTVICPPLFAEYMSTQVALRELAISLSAAGHHVLRFDYRGTGDSARNISDICASDWVDDILLTVNEGVDISGATSVNLVGVRIGGLLLCKALPRIDNIGRVVLWDTVRDGASYLQTLRAITKRLLERNPFLRGADRQAAARDYAGQELGERMVQELTEIGSDVLANLDATAYEALYTDEAYALPASVKHCTYTPFPCNWGTDSEALLMPQPVLESIRESLVSR